MAYVAATADNSFYLPKPYKISHAGKNRKIFEEKFNSDIVFTSEYYKKNIKVSKKLDNYVKPRKEFFEGIQHTLNNYQTEEYLIVGDSLSSDIAFAMNCNFDSCWFNPNKAPLPSKYKPTIIINDLIELTQKL